MTGGGWLARSEGGVPPPDSTDLDILFQRHIVTQLMDRSAWILSEVAMRGKQATGRSQDCGPTFPRQRKRSDSEPSP